MRLTSKEYNDRWKKNNPTYWADRYVAKREEILLQNKEYREANPEKERARHRRYRDTEAGKASMEHTVHARRARIQGGKVDYGISKVSLRRRDGDFCHICDDPMLFVRIASGAYEPMQATIDHVVPLSKSGTHTWDNVKLAHRRCNLSKHNKEN
jgi:5-methylcytosine-specific restriction endonuclease McrA